MTDKAKTYYASIKEWRRVYNSEGTNDSASHYEEVDSIEVNDQKTFGQILRSIADRYDPPQRTYG